MQHSFFDWHCDTAGEMLSQKQPFSSNSLAVSLENARKFKQYVQVMAMFTSYRLGDEEGWERLLKMHRNLLEDEAVVGGKATVCTSCPPRNAATSLLLAVEDIRPLNRRIERVEELYQMGFRIFTPVWYGESCIGGAHNTSTGLTDFGRAAMSEAIGMGILPDISHASEATAEELFEIADTYHRPVIASHSNAHDICPVTRNLRRYQIENLIRCGGVVGINLYTEFLSKDHVATRDDVLKHIEYFLENGAEDALCFGCDMDGADLPEDLHDLAAMPDFADLLLNYYSEETVRKICFENAYHFAERALKPSAENP